MRTFLTVPVGVLLVYSIVIAFCVLCDAPFVARRVIGQFL